MAFEIYYSLIGVGLVAQAILFIGYICDVGGDDADD